MAAERSSKPSTEVVEKIEEAYRSLGVCLDAYIEENIDLRKRLEEENKKHEALKIRYVLDIRSLREEILELQAANADLGIRTPSGGDASAKQNQSFNRRDTDALLKDETQVTDIMSLLFSQGNERGSIVKEQNKIIPMSSQLHSNSFGSQRFEKRDRVQVYKDEYINREDYTESQFNLLPTQYSTEESQVSTFARPKDEIEDSRRKDSEVVTGTLENEDEIEDSQDESLLESLDSLVNLVLLKRRPLAELPNSQNASVRASKASTSPKHCTELETRDYWRCFYANHFNRNPAFLIDLKKNPITRLSWTINDFKLNPRYVRKNSGKKFGLHPIEQRNINKIQKLAKPVVKSGDLRWDNDTNSSGSEDFSESQIYDKFPSPPGFMISEFPDTQERRNRSKIIDERQAARVQRRLRLCLMRAKKKDGEFIFKADILNKYVELNRFII